MKRLALIIAVIMSLAVVDVEEVITSPDTFTVCKAADVATTIYLLENIAGATEANPLMAGLISHGYLPLIAFSAAVVWLIHKVNDPVATGIANVLTCGAAINNLLLIP